MPHNNTLPYTFDIPIFSPSCQYTTKNFNSRVESRLQMGARQLLRAARPCHFHVYPSSFSSLLCEWCAHTFTFWLSIGANPPKWLSRWPSTYSESVEPLPLCDMVSPRILKARLLLTNWLRPHKVSLREGGKRMRGGKGDCDLAGRKRMASEHTGECGKRTPSRQNAPESHIFCLFVNFDLSIAR